ncbi:MAG: AMP-binding protein, partial [bacterium]|nr:AMP-binding protein [bacterium]
NLDILVSASAEMHIHLKYNSLYYESSVIEKIRHHLMQIIRQVTANKKNAVTEIEIVTEAEKKQLLSEFNDTTAEYPRDKTIHQLFEEQAAAAPGNIAAVQGTKGNGPPEEETLTYRELIEKSASLALVLWEKGVKPASIVAIMVERSLEMIVGILAVLKAGGAYLPIDPHYPQDRVTYILKDSSATLLLTVEPFRGKAGEACQILDLVANDLYTGEKEREDREPGDR